MVLFVAGAAMFVGALGGMWKLFNDAAMERGLEQPTPPVEMQEEDYEDEA